MDDSPKDPKTAGLPILHRPNRSQGGTMNILRLSTLSLTLAIAVFALGYVNPSFAGKPGACNIEPPHPSCKDDPVSSIKYKVALEGAFLIPERDATLESRDQVLRSGDPVTIVRPDDPVFPVSENPLQTTWDNVFAFCGLLNGTPTVADFTASSVKKGWTIGRPGGVQIRFRNIGTFSSTVGLLDLTLSLIGDCEYSGGTAVCDPFPPAAGNTSRIPLTDYLVHAGGQPGINSVCHGTRDQLGDHSTLVITAPPVP